MLIQLRRHRLQVDPYSIPEGVKKFWESIRFPNEFLSRLPTVELFMSSGSEVTFPHNSLGIVK